ncbi:hypothetical protein BOO69_11650 [Sulfitobacter alexandrii]|uniref:Uncharacterized protein n=1 Tax=Sulfitobacter alexandrii TaxID=1917485 RepID=A0A1J0WIK3_9RHOB|nr:hypothetical protein [Sulfitobacter alexandrii]APE43990.1 hypothetical protein BOO69_11650 [Sulfitobacter alexandrii]
MRIIFSAKGGSVAYCSTASRIRLVPLFGPSRADALLIETGFARLSAFGANANHAPSGAEGAITADRGLELLYRIAGGH